MFISIDRRSNLVAKIDICHTSFVYKNIGLEHFFVARSNFINLYEFYNMYVI